MRRNTICVDIDVNDILPDISTEDLIEELENRDKKYERSLAKADPFYVLKKEIESIAKCPLFALQDEDICDIVLKSLKRKY